MANKNPDMSGLKPFKKGQSGNPGGRTSAQVRASKQADIARKTLMAKLLALSDISTAKNSVEEIMDDVKVAMVSFGVPVDKSVASLAVDHFGGMADLQAWATRILSSALFDIGVDVTKLKNRRDINTSSRYKVLENAGFKCQACGAKPSKSNSVKLHVDHIIPVSVGGANNMKNLQSLCADCNISKGNRSAYDHNNGWDEIS